uniref:Uncharacterized protein n=1 Tax=Bosea sp. NBC_00436 TaxID=2969620 RepID=A0A9E7ZXU0_9HYPH
MIGLPDESVSEIEPGEAIFRLVTEKKSLADDGSGKIVLTSAAIPMSDLKGGSERYLSLLRPDICDGISLTLRAVSINTKEASWLGDPVVGIASVSEFSEIRDKAGVPEVSIQRKPLQDKLGLFLFHAGLLRNPPHPDNRLDWTTLRIAIAETFQRVSHLSGAEVKL